jgi:serine/threonine-protein kinase
VPTEPETLPEHRIGPYTTSAFIGGGGFAWVLAARHDSRPGEVALKVLKPKYAGDNQFSARFMNEAEVAGQLRHPNIIKILEVGRSGDYAYFAMPRLVTSLAARLDADGALPETEIARTARDISRALAFAHQTGVIHRDIKPHNILFDSNGTAILSDFGIAKAAATYAATTGKQLVLGTPHYISPEQARGLPLDGRTDIYALGVTMYRAATGELPFRSSDWYELARLHVEEPPVPPRKLRPEVSRAFEKIVLTCLEKDRENRYADAGELAEDLEGILTGRRKTAEVALDAVRRLLGKRSSGEKS